MSPRAFVAPSDMSEAQLSDAVATVANGFGWRVAHFAPAHVGDKWRTPVRYDGKGFPDLVLVGPGGILFAELKSANGRMSPDQRAWASDIGLAGGNHRLWRPSDWPQSVAELSLGQARGELVP